MKSREYYRRRPLNCSRFPTVLKLTVICLIFCFPGRDQNASRFIQFSCHHLFFHTVVIWNRMTKMLTVALKVKTFRSLMTGRNLTRKGTCSSQSLPRPGHFCPVTEQANHKFVCWLSSAVTEVLVWTNMWLECVPSFFKSVGDWTGTRLTRGTETLDWRLLAV